MTSRGRCHQWPGVVCQPAHHPLPGFNSDRANEDMCPHSEQWKLYRCAITSVNALDVIGVLKVFPQDLHTASTGGELSPGPEMMLTTRAYEPHPVMGLSPHTSPSSRS